jgi:hypothetical protein
VIPAFATYFQGFGLLAMVSMTEQSGDNPAFGQ